MFASVEEETAFHGPQEVHSFQGRGNEVRKKYHRSDLMVSSAEFAHQPAFARSGNAANLVHSQSKSLITPS